MSLALALSCGALVGVGCGGGDDETGTDGSAGDGSVRTDGGRDSGTDGGDEVDDVDGTVKRDGGGSNTDEDGGGTVVPGPKFTSAQVRQVGRNGADVRIDVDGKAVSGNVTAVRVQLFGSDGSQVALADIDGDGTVDVGSVEYPLSAAITKAGGSAYVVIPKVLAGNALTDHATLALVDTTGVSSDTLDVPLEMQTVAEQGTQCDKTYVADRCAEGLGCKGSPTSCQPGVRPEIETLKYFVDDLGARILAVVADADDDVTTYHIRYLDANGAAVNVVDDDGNGFPDKSELEAPVTVEGAGGKVFVALEVSTLAASAVQQVELSFADKTGFGGVMTASKGVPVAKAVGAACDTRGLDRCSSNNICSATGTSTTGKCVAQATARNSACTAAVLLDPSKGTASVRGVINAPSLWDVPGPGCSSNDPKGRPEALVKLRLAKDASSVILSTNHPYTGFDTTLYVLASCTAAPTPLWCADDRPADGSEHTERAQLTLTNLSKGDYYVVVDSFPQAASVSWGFELSAEVTYK